MPLVSIITATYNQEKYVYKMLESVRNQTFKNFEHIIVDDGSTDKTQTIISQNAENTKIVFQKNSGNAVSRNRAYELSSGRYIAILDGDDWWASTKLEKQINLLNKSKKTGIVYSGIYEVDENDRITSSLKCDDIASDPLRYQLINNAVPFSSMLIDREVLDESSLVDPKFNLVGDRKITLITALQKKNIICIPDGLLYLRQHKNSMRFSSKYMVEYLEQMKLLIFEISNDPRFPDTHIQYINSALGQAYFRAAWLYINSGKPSSLALAFPLLLQCVQYDIHLMPKAIKQMIKSLYKLLACRNISDSN